MGSEDKANAGSGYGCPKFILHSKLGHNTYNTQYLKDDTLYFKVTVTQSDHRPWLDQYH